MTGIHEFENDALRLAAHVLESASFGVTIADAALPDVPLVYVNTAFERISGYTRDEVIGRNCRFLQGADQDQQGVREIRLALREGRAEYALLRNYRKDGSLFWNELTLTPVRDASGAVTHYIGIQQDVTPRKRAMDQLRDSEQRYRALFESSSDGIVYADAETMRLADCNASFAQMLGYDRDEIRRLAVPDIHPPAAHAFVFEQFRRLRDGEVDFVEDIPVLRKDGTIFHAEIAANNVELHGQKILAGFFRDTSARKEANDAIMSGKARLRAILDTAVDGIVTIDARGVIESFNPAAEKLFGYAAAEVIGRNVSVLMPEPYRGEHDRYMHDYLSTGSPHIIGIGREVVARRKDGTTFPIDLAVSEVRVGDLRLFTGIAHDISRRKQYEADLIEAKDIAVKASRVKSDFLSSMSHELRTPLNSIIGFAQLLAGEDPPLTTQQLECVQYILKSGDLLLGLINDVLDLSRVETGRVPLSIEPVPLVDVIESAAQIIQPILQKNNVSLTVLDIPVAVNSVFADYMRVKQVVLNLLANAAKYNRPGGAITVKCELSGDNQVQVSIQDTGIGIPREKQHDVFTSFQRLGREKLTVEGAGIGLVISKRLVELMNGCIGFASEPDVGSTFWITLPRAPSAEPRQIASAMLEHEPASATIAPEQITVLYIEDNPANLRLMECLIGMQPNTRLLTAPEPILGLELATTHRPQLILLDINLPGIDGYEVLRRLRENVATQNIPVIALTANAMPRDLETGAEAGFNDYITKPVDVARFVEIYNTTVKNIFTNDAIGERNQQ